MWVVTVILSLYSVNSAKFGFKQHSGLSDLGGVKVGREKRGENYILAKTWKKKATVFASKI